MHLRVIDWRGGGFLWSLSGIALVCAFTLCIFLFAVRSVCLRVTRSKMLEDALPFTVYATIRRADDAEYIVRSVLERVKWLDLYGMCRIVCLKSDKRPGDRRDYPQTCAKIPVCGDWGFSNTKECSIIEA